MESKEQMVEQLVEIMVDLVVRYPDGVELIDAALVGLMDEADVIAEIQRENSRRTWPTLGDT